MQQLMPSHAFHALTGCDVTSSFGRRGKRTNWSAWEDFENSTPALYSGGPEEVVYALYLGKANSTVLH